MSSYTNYYLSIGKSLIATRFNRGKTPGWKVEKKNTVIVGDMEGVYREAREFGIQEWQIVFVDSPQNPIDS